MPNNWCFWIVVLEKILEIFLNSKELKPVNPKWNQPWMLEALMLKLKVRYFGHLMWTADSLEKTIMLGKIEGKRKKETMEDEMVRQHHWLNGNAFEPSPRYSEDNGTLACLTPGSQKCQIRLSDLKKTKFKGDFSQYILFSYL